MFTAKINLLKFLKMKNLKNLGKTLNKLEQKAINGGAPSLSCFGKEAGDSCGRGICVDSNEYSGNDSLNPYLYCSLLD